MTTVKKNGTKYDGVMSWSLNLMNWMKQIIETYLIKMCNNYSNFSIHHLTYIKFEAFFEELKFLCKLTMTERKINSQNKMIKTLKILIILFPPLS